MKKILNKKIFAALLTMIVAFVMFAWTSPVTYAAEGDPVIVIQNLESGTTYQASGLHVEFTSNNAIEAVDPLNGYSGMFIDSYGYINVDYNDTSGLLTLNYQAVAMGTFVDYSSDIFVVILTGNSITVSSTTGGNISGNAFQITINKREGISGEENFVTNVDDAKPLSFFLDYISAWDNVDGDLSSSIVVETDNYTPNMAVLGTHQVDLSVTDSSNNESTFTFFVTVVDITKPVITGNTTKVQISYTQTWNVTTFKNGLSVSDNYDTLDASDISVLSDGYTSNKTNLGTYNVVYRVIDASGNVGTFTKQVEVIDDIAPVINGPLELITPVNTILTVGDIITEELTASDDKDGNRTAYITIQSDEYTGYGNVVGSYDVVFQVSDTKGNIATHTVTIIVQDNIPPVWYIADGASIVLAPPLVLNHTQIIQLLEATGQISVSSTSQVTFFLDEYTGNENEPGVYLMGFNFENVAGNSSVHNFAITVLSDDGEDPITVEPDPWHKDVMDWFNTNPVGQVVGTVLIILAVIAFAAILVKIATSKSRKARKKGKKRHYR